MFSEPLVTDPSDWAETQVPEVSEFDSIIRCHICKDLMKAPVMTSCYHSFCSICIRRSLKEEEKCPLCGTRQYEANLKKILVLDELILWYSKHRSSLINKLEVDNIKMTENETNTSGDLIKKPKTLEAKFKKMSNSTIPDSDQPKEDVIEIDEDGDSDTSNGKRDRDPNWDDATSENEVTNEKPRRDIKRLKRSNAFDSDETTKKDSNSDRSSIPSSPRQKEKTDQNEEAPKFIECPVCQELMTKEEIESTHLSKCLQEREEAPSSSITKPKLKSSISSSKSTSPFFSSSPAGKSRNITDLLSRPNSSKSSTSRLKLTKKPQSPTSYFDRNPSSIASSTFKAPSSTSTRSTGPRTEHQVQHKELQKTSKLTVLDFTSYSTNKLKQKLQSLNLPTDGTRLQLENRYNEYRILFNANLDSIHPVSTKSLIHQLHQYEATVNFNPHVENNEGKKKKETNENKQDRYSWNKEHSTDFRELIKQARGQLKNKKPPVSVAISDTEGIENPEVTKEDRAESSDVRYPDDKLFVDDEVSDSPKTKRVIQHSDSSLTEINGIPKKVGASEPLFLSNNGDEDDTPNGMSEDERDSFYSDSDSDDDYSLMFNNKTNSYHRNNNESNDMRFDNKTDVDTKPINTRETTVLLKTVSQKIDDLFENSSTSTSVSPKANGIHSKQKDFDDVSIDSISDSELDTDNANNGKGPDSKYSSKDKTDATSGGVSRNLRTSTNLRRISSISADEEVIEVDD